MEPYLLLVFSLGISIQNTVGILNLYFAFSPPILKLETAVLAAGLNFSNFVYFSDFGPFGLPHTPGMACVGASRSYIIEKSIKIEIKIKIVFIAHNIHCNIFIHATFLWLDETRETREKQAGDVVGARAPVIVA